MQQTLKLQTVDNHFLISIDKSYIEKDFLIRLMNRINLEYLSKKIDFDESIESLGEEIKAIWWDENKDRLLNQKQ